MRDRLPIPDRPPGRDGPEQAAPEVELSDQPDDRTRFELHALPQALWGYRALSAAIGLPRRAIERAVAAGRFPRPVLRIHRRPYWDPAEVGRWLRGGRR